MASLTTRVISALVAVAIVTALTMTVGTTALVSICVFVILMSIVEYERMTLLSLQVPRSLRILFVGCCAGSLCALTFREDFALTYLGALNCILFSAGLWLTRGKIGNEKLLQALALGSVGMIYCVVLPSFAVRMLFLEQGMLWFFACLIVVLAGDTFAYFGGAFFGKRPLMPSLSPKKTIEGAIAGALGSVASGGIFVAVLMPNVPVVAMMLVSLLIAAAGQSGDLFASLVKRVGQVKDSGSIMPGHGGVLDRFDGLYFAAPVMYGFASWFEGTL